MSFEPGAANKKASPCLLAGGKMAKKMGVGRAHQRYQVTSGILTNKENSRRRRENEAALRMSDGIPCCEIPRTEQSVSGEGAR